VVDAIAVNQIPDHTFKFKAPGFLEPISLWTPAATMDRLLENYAQFERVSRDNAGFTSACTGCPSAYSSSKGLRLNGWISVDARHGGICRTSPKQILEVKVDANFQ
jgi:hypothetical protein